jgi:hypothetical protein
MIREKMPALNEGGIVNEMSKTNLAAKAKREGK